MFDDDLTLLNEVIDRLQTGLTATAFAHGTITEAHARALMRALNPRTVDAFAEHEQTLVGYAARFTADELLVLITRWLACHDPDGTEPPIEGIDDKFHLSETSDGRLKGNFDIGGESAILIKAAMDEKNQQLLARDKTNRDIDPTDPLLDQLGSQRNARALTELLQQGTAADANPARRRPQFIIHTTLDTLAGTATVEDWMLHAEHAWRSAIPTTLAQTWACDSTISRVLLDQDGVLLDLGRAARTANEDQRRALAARDHGCGVPGCDRPVAWTDAHHLHWWQHGGSTNLDNLVLCCRWHHRRIHSGHITVEMINHTPVFHLRDGTPLTEPRPPPQATAA